MQLTIKATLFLLLVLAFGQLSESCLNVTSSDQCYSSSCENHFWWPDADDTNSQCSPCTAANPEQCWKCFKRGFTWTQDGCQLLIHTSPCKTPTANDTCPCPHHYFNGATCEFCKKADNQSCSKCTEHVFDEQIGLCIKITNKTETAFTNCSSANKLQCNRYRCNGYFFNKQVTQCQPCSSANSSQCLVCHGFSFVAENQKCEACSETQEEEEEEEEEEEGSSLNSHRHSGRNYKKKWSRDAWKQFYDNMEKYNNWRRNKGNSSAKNEQFYKELPTQSCSGCPNHYKRNQSECIPTAKIIINLHLNPTKIFDDWETSTPAQKQQQLVNSKDLIVQKILILIGYQNRSSSVRVTNLTIGSIKATLEINPSPNETLQETNKTIFETTNDAQSQADSEFVVIEVSSSIQEDSGNSSQQSGSTVSMGMVIAVVSASILILVIVIFICCKKCKKIEDDEMTPIPKGSQTGWQKYKESNLDKKEDIVIKSQSKDFELQSEQKNYYK